MKIIDLANGLLHIGQIVNLNLIKNLNYWNITHTNGQITFVFDKVQWLTDMEELNIVVPKSIKDEIITQMEWTVSSTTTYKNNVGWECKPNQHTWKPSAFGDVVLNQCMDMAILKTVQQCLDMCEHVQSINEALQLWARELPKVQITFTPDKTDLTIPTRCWTMINLICQKYLIGTQHIEIGTKGNYFSNRVVLPTTNLILSHKQLDFQLGYYKIDSTIDSAVLGIVTENGWQMLDHLGPPQPSLQGAVLAFTVFVTHLLASSTSSIITTMSNLNKDWLTCQDAQFINNYAPFIGQIQVTTL